MILVLALAEALKDPGWSQQSDDSVRECGEMRWMGPSGEMAEAGFSSGAWCSGEDKLPSDIRVCSGARPGGGWEMLDNQSHDSSRLQVCGVTSLRAKPESGVTYQGCKQPVQTGLSFIVAG